MSIKSDRWIRRMVESERMIEPFRDRIRLNSPVEKVVRRGSGVEVVSAEIPAQLLPDLCQTARLTVTVHWGGPLSTAIEVVTNGCSGCFGVVGR